MTYYDAAEREAVQQSTANLGVEERATHAQVVRKGIRDSGTWPPVAEQALMVQITTTAVEVSRIYQRQRVAAKLKLN